MKTRTTTLVAATAALLIGVTSAASALPAVQKVREAASRPSLQTQEERYDYHPGSEFPELDLLSPEEREAVLIGLLLPAVQKAR